MVQKNLFKGKAKDKKAAANRHGKLVTQRKGTTSYKLCSSLPALLYHPMPLWDAHKKCHNLELLGLSYSYLCISLQAGCRFKIVRNDDEVTRVAAI